MQIKLGFLLGSILFIHYNNIKLIKASSIFFKIKVNNLRYIFNDISAEMFRFEYLTTILINSFHISQAAVAFLTVNLDVFG